jgi:hypothetical protein
MVAPETRKLGSSMFMRCIALAVALAFAAAPVRANDSAAAIGQGGLVLIQQGDVAMLSEDLYVSAPKIRVKYEFRNEGAAPVKTLVAFPLPKLDLDTMQDSEIGWPSSNQTDPTGFTVKVDGVAVKPKLEAKATLGGKDVTQQLKSAGVPIVYPFGDFWDRVKKIKKAEIDKLAKAGLVDVFDGQVRPKWTLENAYYWEQTYPPGKIVAVEHEYAPVNGGSFWPEGMIKTEAAAAKDEFFREFCLDQQTVDGIAKKLAADKARNPDGVGMLSYIDVRYILKTGKNWRGPIGKFKLTVDKGRPANLVSFCADGVRKTGPTTFVVEKTNWEPDRDLSVLVLQSMQ